MISARRPAVAALAPGDILPSRIVSADLGRTSVRGAALTGGGQATMMVLRLGSTAILARLLTPQDYGLVAMTTVIVGLVSVTKDAGLASATIQRENITHGQVSMLFWINAGLGVAAAGIVAALAPAIAAFYNEPRLVGITLALALPFICGGFTVQHQALLRREMLFKSLVALDVGAMAGGIATGILMAYLGFGYWSLVGLSLGSALVQAIGVWLLCPWRPTAPRRGTGVRPLLKFGGNVLSFNLVNYFSRQSDSLLIGRFVGPAALGLYDKAYGLLLLPVSQINGPMVSVAVPTLSRLHAEPARYAAWFTHALQFVASLSIPLVVGLAVFADVVVRVLLGPNWAGTAELFRLLAPAAALGALGNPVGWLLISSGRTATYKHIGLINSAVIVLAFSFGVQFGTTGVAIAYSLAMGATIGPTWWLATRGSPVRLSDVARAVIPVFISVAPAGAVAWLILSRSPTVDGAATATTVIAALGTMIAIYLTMLLVGFRRWNGLMTLLREFRRPR